MCGQPIRFALILTARSILKLVALMLMALRLKRPSLWLSRCQKLRRRPQKRPPILSPLWTQKLLILEGKLRQLLRPSPLALM